MMKKLILLFVSLCFVSSNSYGLSAYENRMLADKKQRIGLVAFAPASQVKGLKKIAQKVESQHITLAGENIHNLSIYFRELNEKVMVFAYFESPDKTITGWEKRLASSSSELTLLTNQLIPHKRAKKDEKWLRMEWMNLVASDTVFPYKNKPVQKMGLISGLKPQHELEYRQLHQANWPGVVDGMVKSNYRNWTTFLVEVDSSLYLFTYAEYIGTDIDADNKVMAADPTTQRWWTHTEKCLLNLHGEGNWSSMSPLVEVTK